MSKKLLALNVICSRMKMCKKQLLWLWPLVFSPVYTVYTCYETDVIRHLISKRRENVSEPEQKLTVVSKEAWVKTPIKTLGQGFCLVVGTGQWHAPPSASFLNTAGVFFLLALVTSCLATGHPDKSVCVYFLGFGVCVCVYLRATFENTKPCLFCSVYFLLCPSPSLLFSSLLLSATWFLSSIKSPPHALHHPFLIQLF